MKITATTTVLATAATVGIIGAPLASAEDVTTTTVGSQNKLTDGDVVQGWTISDLRPSSDAIPYPVAGALWEATATDEAIQGAATPIVSNLNARTGNGQTYRVLFGVATPQGVNPATIGQGDKTTGKVYFDVTGDAPARRRLHRRRPGPAGMGAARFDTPPARNAAVAARAQRRLTRAGRDTHNAGLCCRSWC